MAVYIVGAIEVHDRELYRQYSELARVAMADFDMECISADDHPVMYEGSQPANHLMIFKFKSREDYEAFVASPAYQKALTFRKAGSTTSFIMAMQPPGGA
jgi:uncharacterized protein (DUF1330 family)